MPREPGAGRSVPVHRRRRLAIAIGSVLAVLTAWFAWRHARPAAAPAGFDRARVAELLERRRLAAPRSEARRATEARSPEDRRWYVPPEDASTIFESQTRVNRYDPWCYYAHKPGLLQEVAWPEHPRGRWTYRTNGSGLRDDDEVRAARPDLRVLVTGDSHTEGFCDNADSFANRLESSLALRAPEAVVEVLNAANLAYTFYNYLGVLEKHVDLAPDVFVVTVHSGNDLREALLPYRYFARLPLPPKEHDQRAPAGGDADIFVPASHQGLLSVAWFRDQPEEQELAFRAGTETFQEMQRICRERGIALIVVHLPSPVEVEMHRLADLITPTLRALRLEQRDVAAHGALARRFVEHLRGMGIDVLDMTEVLRAAPGPCFWRQDLHLNLEGHARIARTLEPLVLEAAGWPR